MAPLGASRLWASRQWGLALPPLGRCNRAILRQVGRSRAMLGRMPRRSLMGPRLRQWLGIKSPANPIPANPIPANPIPASRRARLRPTLMPTRQQPIRQPPSQQQRASHQHRVQTRRRLLSPILPPRHLAVLDSLALLVMAR